MTMGFMVQNKKTGTEPVLYLARPERFELPTAWFVVSNPIANVLFLNIDYWNARCPICTTMQDDA